MQYLWQIIREERKNYLQQVKQLAAEYDGIIIYGAGIYGKGLARLLQKNQMRPVAYCVTSYGHNRSQEWGVPILSFAEICGQGKDYLYLIAAEPPMNTEMMKTLQTNQITSYVDITPHFAQIIDEVYFRPIMEITSRVGCSMHCRYCPQDLFIKAYGAAERQTVLSFETFKLCLDKLPREVVIDFAGYAEPFLNPDIIDMMEYAAAQGRDIRLFTTLTGLTLEGFERIKSIPFLSVVLHLPDKNQFANIPLTDTYYYLLEKCLATSKADGQPFVDHANAQCEPPKDILNRLGGRVRVTWDVIDWAGNIGADGVRTSTLKSGPLLCAMAACQNHNILLPDGRVVLCCMDWGMQNVLGNMLAGSYEDITQGRKIQRIREMMECGEFPDDNFLCCKCTSAIMIQK